MQNQEFLHVHASFFEIARYSSDRERRSPEALLGYDALDTRPTSVHNSKRHHQEAVEALATGIEQWLERERDERPGVSMP